MRCEEKKVLWWVVVGGVVFALAWPGVTPLDRRALATVATDWELKNGSTSREEHPRDLVVVAGLSRTGTSSLQGALRALNLKVRLCVL